ncbi:hypothetical protein AB0E08_11030 [Streptomyces sp. NPDC048281]|uniref:hypothetical protein n=1 Tax=Streptomyces sp. NPDC048281 TaxID=3154715 RepID=UPI0034219AE6
MSTTVQSSPTAGNLTVGRRADAVTNALLALETLFRATVDQAEARGQDPAVAGRDEADLVKFWATELCDRFTNPERRLEDLAAEHDIDVRTSSASGLTEACLVDSDGILVVPVGQDPADTFAQLRAALAERGQA